MQRSPARSSTSPTTRAVAARVRGAVARRRSSTAPPSTTSTSASARRTGRSRSTPARCKRLAERCADARREARPPSAPTTSSTGPRPEPYAEDDLPNSAQRLRDLEARRRARGARVLRPARSWSAAPGSTGCTGAPRRAATSSQRMLERARASRASSRWSPTSGSRRPSPPTWRRRWSRRSRRDAHGVLHLTNSGACSWLEFTQAIMALAGSTSRSSRSRPTVRAGGADRAAQRRARAPGAPTRSGSRRCAPGARRSPTTWRRAGLIAAAPATR